MSELSLFYMWKLGLFFLMDIFGFFKILVIVRFLFKDVFVESG